MKLLLVTHALSITVSVSVVALNGFNPHINQSVAPPINTIPDEIGESYGKFPYIILRASNVAAFTVP